MSKAAPIPDDVVNEAIGWMIALRENSLSATELREMDVWLSADIRHRQAWERLKGALEPFRIVEKGFSGARVITTFEQQRMSRRAVMGRTMGCFAVAASSLSLADRFSPLSNILSDYGTETGERRSFALPDGSTLALDARSQANLAFGAGRRGVTLDGGMAVISALPAAMPFRVNVDGLAAALPSGRLLVSVRGGSTRAIALDAPALLMLKSGTSIRAKPGQGFVVVDGELRPLPGNETLDAASWLNGQLILHNRTLGDLVDAYRPYQAGVLSITQRAAATPVSGVFDLNNFNYAIAMVQTLKPVRLIEVGPVFRHIDLLFT